MKDKRLFFVGIPQNHVQRSIERAQRLGYEVILGDNEKNLSEKAHLIRGADKLVVTDYTSYDNLSAVTRLLYAESPLDAIFTFKEAGAVVTARVVQDYQLKGNTPEVVEACNNKFLTRERLKEAGMLSPAYTLCRTVEEVRAFWQHVGTSIVMKPHNLQGSIGVVKVSSDSELEMAFQTCLEHCEEPLILVEEFIDGRELSIEAMVYQGDVVVFGVTEKLLYPNSFVEAGHTSPDGGPEMSHAQYKDLVRQVVEAIGITFGPLHLEGFQTKRGFVCGEIHTRYGGDHIVTLTEIAMKCDMTSPIFAELGDIPYVVTFGEPKEVVGIRFLDIPPGKVTVVEGINEVWEMPEIVDVEVSCNPGAVVNPVLSSFDRVGWILAKAAEREKLEIVFRQALRKLRIITENTCKS
ncbi:MAG TPA: ATP-grasp domain-containing protein [Ktedonosporobacter sp.]|jgi:biotin carboxylase|nr:ATP-grasp domain-containing protein [Ktedonosporobacter sp.]